MQRVRATGVSCFLLCGCVAWLVPACDEAAGGDHQPGALSEGLEVGRAGFLVEDDGCLTRAAGAGFASVSLPTATTLGVTDFEAQPSALQLDGVIGLSRGPALQFGQLAAAVRFAPTGLLDVRDGGTYRADTPFLFQPNRAYPVRIVADVGARAYSVYVQDPDTGDTLRLARRYAFRPSAAAAPGLDALSAIVDGPSGELAVCQIVGAGPGDVIYSREGSYDVAPLPADQALVSDRISTTWKLGPAGEVLGEVPRGGTVAADQAGNVYVALATGGQLAIHAYTAGLVPRWSRVDPLDHSEAFAGVQAISADTGGVTVALATAQGLSSIRRYPNSGSSGVRIHGAATLAALSREGFAIATASPGSVVVSLHDPAGNLRWIRSFQVEATAEVLTIGLGGNVVLGGHFEAPITFGGPTLDPVPAEVDVNSYVVALSAIGGAHVFTAWIPTTRLTGAAASADRLVVAGETWVTPIFPHLWQLDAAGSQLPGEPFTGFYEQWGRSGRVAIGASNRIYWERSMIWPEPTSPAFPYLLALVPSP